MDLEVVGRHALLFDDDSMAAFVNSADALVEWNSLQIDRYDVRHLLSAPLPPRRRNRNLESISADEFLIDQERYLDLPPDSDQPEVEDGEKPSGSDSYHSVAFSYGIADDSADQKNTNSGMESSGYFPPFAVPGNIVQILPPTEKVHQIIARTAMFVNKHGGQSEIVLRVKQGDNPTFGFLMPDHHLHPYFRYLVEHPELLHAEFNEKSQDERKKAGIEYNNSNSVGGALSLLGSVYGSGEDEDGDAAANPSPTQDKEKVAPMGNAATDEVVSRKPILSNKENIHAVKKNSSIIASKPKNVKGIKKEGDSGLLSAEEKSKSDEIGATSQLILEPPPEMKRLIDKLVEFVMRNGKQFEATLLAQDNKHERFPFLLPSNRYHPYYLRALRANQESKVNGKSVNSGKDDPRSSRLNKKASTNDLSHSTSDFEDVPFESDRKEKFKMVIGKPKKDGHELEKGTEDSGVTVDAAAAAAILDAATRGIKNSDSHNHLNRSEGGQSVGGADSSDANLTEEQRRKAERLKRAKMFVAMLKSGAVPTKAGTSRDPSVEPQEPRVLRSAHEVNHNNKEREGSSAAEAVKKPGGMGILGGKQSERLLKRKYRSKLGGCEDDEESEGEDQSRRKYRSRSRRDEDAEDEMECKRRKENGRRGSRTSEEDKSGGESSEEGGRNNEKHGEHRSKRKHRSRSRRDEVDYEVRNAVKKERRHRKRRHRSHSSEESGSKEESGESDREHKHYKKAHHEKRSRRRNGDENKDSVGNEDKHYGRSYSSHSSYEEKNNEEDRDDEVGSEDVYKKEKGHKRRHHSHHSSERRKKHRTHRSSHDKHGHRNPRSTRDESRAHHRHDTSSELPRKEDELEEGEVSSKVSEESRGITSDGGERGISVDVVSSQRRATSQPSDTTEIPADLRAKIRAMLMVTRS